MKLMLETVLAADGPTVVARFDERDHRLCGGRVVGELAHGQHRRLSLPLGLSLHQCDRADDGIGESARRLRAALLRSAYVSA